MTGDGVPGEFDREDSPTLRAFDSAARARDAYRMRDLTLGKRAGLLFSSILTIAAIITGCRAAPVTTPEEPTHTRPPVTASPDPTQEITRDYLMGQGYDVVECDGVYNLDFGSGSGQDLQSCLIARAPDLGILWGDSVPSPSGLRGSARVYPLTLTGDRGDIDVLVYYDTLPMGGDLVAYEPPDAVGGPDVPVTVGPTATLEPSPTATMIPPTATPEPSPTATDVPASPTPAYTPTPGPNSDIDGDGIPLWEEQLYGTNPEVAENWGDYGFVWPLLDTPEKSAGFANRHLRFMSDAPATFITPQETLTRGGGNCTMNATFTCDPLLRNGYNFMGTTNQAPAAAPFNVQWVASDPRGGHATCVYTLNGSNLYYIDNTEREFGVIRGPFNTIEQIKDDMARRSNAEWRWYEFFTTSYQFGYGRVDKP